MNSIEFVELEQLQPDVLVHAVLRVVDITVQTGNHFGQLLNFRFKIKIQDLNVPFGYHYIFIIRY